MIAAGVTHPWCAVTTVVVAEEASFGSGFGLIGFGGCVMAEVGPKNQVGLSHVPYHPGNGGKVPPYKDGSGVLFKDTVSLRFMRPFPAMYVSFETGLSATS